MESKSREEMDDEEWDTIRKRMNPDQIIFTVTPPSLDQSSEDIIGLQKQKILSRRMLMQLKREVCI